MNENNEIKTEELLTTKKSTALATTSIFEEDANSGLENLTTEDLTIPRLKILQALSPEVNKRDGKHIKDSSAGDITNTVTKELYTEENVCVVIPVAYKRMFLEWQPRETGGGLAQQHLDPAILTQTTRDKTGAEVLPNGNYIQTSATHYCVVVAKNSYQQVMIPMAGTQLKKSRTWNSVMAGIQTQGSEGRVFTPPSYSHKYSLKTVAESNDRGTWFGWDIQLMAMLGEEEMFLYEAAKKFASNITFENNNTSSVPF